MAHPRNLSKAMEALLKKQSQWLQHLQQQNLSFIEQLHQQNLRMVEQLRMNQRMLTRMLELLREGVEEEEEVSKVDGCAEHHPLADASQVFDENPQKNSHVKSDEWLDGGQDKLLEGQLTSSTCDNLVSTAQGRQPGYVQMAWQPLSLPVPKDIYLSADSEISSRQPANNFCKALTSSDSMHIGLQVAAAHAATNRAFTEFYNPSAGPFEHATLRGFGVEGVDDGWQWAKSFLFMAFDPGGMSSLPKWLLLAMLSSIQSSYVVEKNSLESLDLAGAVNKH